MTARWLRTRWSPAELELLVRLYHAGEAAETIAATLSTRYGHRRTVNAVYLAIRKRGLTRHAAAATPAPAPAPPSRAAAILNAFLRKPFGRGRAR